MIIKILSIICIFISTINSSKVVKTLNGPVRGREINVLDTTVTEYLGIPFAKPPTGELRFKSPEPLAEPEWNETFDATKPAKACLQCLDRKGFEGLDNYTIPESEQSEDCLQLNMWVPEKTTGAVIIFIFGGGFRFGSPSLDIYNGSVLAQKTKAIVINLNYRLGIFGFSFMTQGNDIKGNMGLLDQQMGMRWVHKNIKSFGGNPDKITLWGNGAGSASVTAHLLSVDSHPYFKRIIAGSGVITNIWARHYYDFVGSSTRLVAFRNNCTGRHHELYECLKKLDVNQLLYWNDNYAIKVNMPFTYGFNILDKDEVFFKGKISEKVSSRQIKHNVDILIGRTTNEGSYFLPTLLDRLEFGCKDKDSHLFKYSQNTCKMTSDDLNNFKSSLKKTLRYINSTVLNLLNKLYFDRCTNYRKCSTLLLSDIAYNCEIIEFAKSCAFNTNGYISSYILDIESTAHKWPTWTKSVHGVELEYQFGLPFRKPNLYAPTKLEEEKKFSNVMMKIIKNFIESGNPGLKWPRFDPYNITNARLDLRLGDGRDVTQEVENIIEKCNVINKYVPKYICECKD